MGSCGTYSEDRDDCVGVLEVEWELTKRQGGSKGFSPTSRKTLKLLLVIILVI